MSAELLDHHAELLGARGVSPQVATARGYTSTVLPGWLRQQGFSLTAAQQVPGLVIPIRDVHGDLAFYQYRPDKPRQRDGKLAKYEMPAKARMVLDVPPQIRGKLADPAPPLWVTEAPIKADAAVTAGAVCVATFGVYGWRGTNRRGGKTALACWEYIALDGRTVYLAPDSDVATNQIVAAAVTRLGRMLESRGADVRYVFIPTGGDGRKLGLDDYLAGGGTLDELVRNADDEPPDGAPVPPRAAVSQGGSEKPGTTTPAPVVVPPPCTLADVERAFLDHHKHGDLVALRATLACYAANLRLDGDPVWLGLVAGSSTGKTETVAALSGCPRVTVASTLSGEAALLSGTPAKDRAADATGGLLREVGDRGVLVLKDFTTILSMHPDKRGQILSALREVYDGRWYRDIGTGGGQRLEWHGKLGLVMCSTTAYDRAYGVIALMGDRFVLVRLDDDNRTDGTIAALTGAGRETAARAELAAAAAGLLGNDPPAPPLDATDDDLAALAAVADFVTLARSPVARDYTGEIELVLDAEGPYRFGKQLYALWRACGLLDLDRQAAWQVARRVARDSMPRLRWRVIKALADGAEHSTNAVARATWHPARSTKRALEELTAHQVVKRLPASASPHGGREDRWQLLPIPLDAAQLLAGVVPEFSDPPRDDLFAASDDGPAQ